ncbi:MAG: PHP domain-containing protein [Bacilli bacterium]|nr:PHP domain-containing protein [Bacilli bacterium]
MSDIMDDFVNLHVHTLFSKQDAVIKINDLINKIQEYNQSAVAITDHSSTAGHWYLKQACNNTGIKPIFGNEFYTNISYENKTRDRNHIVCLAMNDEGVRNINRLQDVAVHNMYYKPIVSHDILPDYTEGIFATSACSLGIIPQMILQNDLIKAEEYCNWFMDIFNEHFALELQMHPDYPEQNKINNVLVELSDRLNIPLTISSDAHFLDESDSDLRRVIQCIAWKTQYKDGKDSLKSNCLGNTDIILHNAQLSNFDIDIAKKAIKNTQKIANKCNGDLCSSDRKVPIFDKHQEFDKLFNEEL